ncbi:MAG: zinc ribbon domain-containing protein [Ruminococcus sp.]|nr:zinc ribbon domain-containing protein [Ruminococcus sp.]
MIICKKCGAELANEAKICRECGALQEKAADNSAFFSVPYLSAAPKKPASVQTPEAAATEEKKTSPQKPKKEKLRIEDIADPRERAFAKQDRRNKMIRITALLVVIVLAIAGGLYLLLRNTGYHRTLDQFLDGRTSSGGTRYTAIVPETYLIEAERLYDMARPDIRSNVDGYLKYVEEQLIADYGSGVNFTYKIIAEETMDDKATTDTLEDTIRSAYDVDLSVTEVAYVSIRLTTKGSLTQTTETDKMTFFKCDDRWCSLDAMQVVQFACENAGYQLW